MINFNDYHIFTGQIKELLADFYLPKYRAGKWLKTDVNYSWGKNLKNYSRRLKIRTNAYDSYTHEYLGWYLRFLRDYKHIDLMPLYNCFSDNECSNIELSEVSFNSYDSNYKIYSMPVMLGKKYTIAIDSHLPVEICLAIYDKYQSTNQFSIPYISYKKYSSTYFNNPVLYDTEKFIEKFKAEAISGREAEQQKILDTYEADIRIFIKLPIENKSAITILEGDYRHWNDHLLRQVITKDARGNDIKTWEAISNHWVTNFENKTIDENGFVSYNFENACIHFKPITNLQLLKINSGVSYPFSDRLMEYLTGNVITDDDDIADNVERVQQTLSFASWTDAEKDTLINYSYKQKGLWDYMFRPVFYNAMQIDKLNGNDKNYDILGYVDKEVETYFRTFEYISPTELQANSNLLESLDYVVKSKEDWFMHYGDWSYEDGVYKVHTIANEDIYPDLYKDSK